MESYLTAKSHYKHVKSRMSEGGGRFRISPSTVKVSPEIADNTVRTQRPISQRLGKKNAVVPLETVAQSTTGPDTSRSISPRASNPRQVIPQDLKLIKRTKQNTQDRNQVVDDTIIKTLMSAIDSFVWSLYKFDYERYMYIGFRYLGKMGSFNHSERIQLIQRNKQKLESLNQYFQHYKDDKVVVVNYTRKVLAFPNGTEILNDVLMYTLEHQKGILPEWGETELRDIISMSTAANQHGTSEDELTNEIQGAQLDMDDINKRVQAMVEKERLEQNNDDVF
jgi:hypothetical protein